MYFIKFYCAGQCLGIRENIKDNRGIERIIQELQKKLNEGELKVSAGSGEMIAETLCIDVHDFSIKLLVNQHDLKKR